MYLLEWGFWKMNIETAEERKATDATKTPAERRADKDFYADDLAAEIQFNPVSCTPNIRGPVFSFNDIHMDIRCGGSEEKRGIITLMTLGSLIPLSYFWTKITAGFIHINISRLPDYKILTIALTILVIFSGLGLIYLYLKHGFQITRLEILTSRHLLVRFNRKTQQVHLHRPK
ncbi:hypothetical protein N5D31_26450, partial [Pseudomonas sp. GD03867]|nr:hypothetical protein [Pseudomonas sp. GD03867]